MGKIVVILILTALLTGCYPYPCKWEVGTIWVPCISNATGEREK